MKNLKSQRLFWLAAVAFMLAVPVTIAQSEVVKVNSFEKVIISPHVEVVFQKGTEESVTINSISESRDKLNIEVNSNTLRIYLDDAKMTTKNKKVDYEGWKQKVPIYKGTVVRATVTYKDISELSLRGEEEYKIKDVLQQDKFVLSIYGDSEVTIDEVDFNNSKTTIYGECEFKIKKGAIENQKLTLYGDSEVLLSNVESKTAKITAYGDGEVKVNVAERLKVTAYGETEVYYKGNPKVDKGLILGEATIESF
ncbi:hypothetical protein KH5_06120 [Urechidicola sp. KH5]